MNIEEKQLLLVDLCARLPYGVMVKYSIHEESTICGEHEELNEEGIAKITGFNGIQFIIDGYKASAESIKPYLRPMSSMTEEEYECFVDVLKRSMIFRKCYDWHEQWIQSPFVEEWLNKNHFDYRGLIEKGLALEAPEKMYC